ncbi:MAG: hypothetical protein ACI4GX_00280 [Ruminococcus sp.]|uniref:hypothetical protein n=1 Tax=Ruminococcus sp. TaxID=41978 RepID=UPI003EFE985D
MAFADYTYYSDSFGGMLIPSSEFCTYAAKAERLVRFVTQHRITEVTDEVKNAVCAAAEASYEIRSSIANVPQGVKSENTDGYSVTYKDYDADELKYKEQNAMLAAIRQELSGTGLLYQGVC